jgi:hypothetical protein
MYRNVVFARPKLIASGADKLIGEISEQTDEDSAVVARNSSCNSDLLCRVGVSHAP